MKNIISQTLLESLNIYQTFALISVNKDVDRMDIFNALRAIPNVIIVKPKDSDLLNDKETKDVGYSYVNIKFLSNHSAIKDFMRIRKYALQGGIGTPRVEGLISFIFNSAKIIKL